MMDPESRAALLLPLVTRMFLLGLVPGCVHFHHGLSAQIRMLSATIVSPSR